MKLQEAYRILEAMTPPTVSREAAEDSLEAGAPEGAILALIEDAMTERELTWQMLEFARKLDLSSPYELLLDLVESDFRDNSVA
ncbi:hypothetical protein [Corynebacterium renale]|uniref:Uncharacterized protein n=1 Tax=Corynebacterium renale TaxID=1724 RepID=A0A2A9DPL7_9CORY|nr:hypothetical protein [Corynebacterium renale]PFG28321.1 hypothetical protein ATK06_1428 [Corynebacterium renale]SQI19014.1 Uncharacterised protein [Corynebacterium renale]